MKKKKTEGLNPLVHIQNIPYRYDIMDQPNSQPMAFVAAPTKEKPYHHIFLNKYQAQKTYEESWVKDAISFDDYCGALTAHEVFHVKFETFSKTSQLAKNDLWKTIDNIFEDSRIEYRGVWHFPIYSHPIHLLLASIRYKADFSHVGSKDNPVLQEIDQDMNTLFHLVRFGVILPESNQEFVNFALPLAITSRRSSRAEIIKAANAVYYYLEQIAYKDESVRNKLSQTKGVLVPISKEQMEKLLRSKSLSLSDDDGDGEGLPVQVMQSPVLDAAREELRPLVSPSAGAGASNTTVKVEKVGNEFVQQTLAQFWTEKEALRRCLRLLFTKKKRVKAYDGDLAVKHQMDAFLGVLAGDDQKKHYLVTKPMIPDIEFGIFQDVSGSTALFKVFFAQLSVILHAAIEETPGANSLHISFSDDAQIEKSFSQKIYDSNIHPRIAGGTQFESAIDLLKNITFRAKQRLIFVVTDGEFYGHKYLETMEQLRREKGLLFILVKVTEEGKVTDAVRAEPITYIGPSRLPLYESSLRAFPRLFYALLVKRLFRS